MKKICLFVFTVVFTSFFVFASSPQDKLKKAVALLNSGNSKAALAEISDAVMDIENTMSLYLKNLTRVKSVNGFGDFVPEEGWVMQAGQDLNIYFEIYGFHVFKKNGNYNLWISEDVVITDASGKKVFERNKWIELKQGFPYPLCPVYLLNTISDMPKGVYNYKIVLHDMVSGKDLTKTLKITVK